MTEVLDVDLDYVVLGSAGESDQVEQSVSELDRARCHEWISHPTSSVWFMDEHVHALAVWQALGIRDARCWHIDAHHDLYGATDMTAWRVQAGRPFEEVRSQITSATFLLYAWRSGIIREIIWIRPTWIPHEAAAADLRREMGECASIISITDADSVILPPIDVLTIAWSRRWIRPELHAEVAGHIPGELRDRAITHDAPHAWTPVTSRRSA